MENLIETPHGIITEDTTEWWKNKYTTYRDKAKHYFRNYNGYGISQTEMDLIIKYKCQRIIFRIKEIDKIIIYKVMVSDVNERLKQLQKYDNLGDKQIIIPIEMLSKIAESV